MTNEIKEILDIFYNEYPKEEKILEKYITILQEGNEEWERIFDTFSRRPYAHRYLEEKRKKLNNDNIIGLDSESVYKDYYNLQERIDKAVEYINKYEYQKYCPSPYEKDKYIMKEEKEGQDLLKILKGDNNE